MNDFVKRNQLKIFLLSCSMASKYWTKMNAVAGLNSQPITADKSSLLRHCKPSQMGLK
jgi:hypothetical protein